MCEPLYQNHIPLPPFLPKLLTAHLPKQRLYQFCGAGIENVYKEDILTENDIGVPIDFVHHQVYRKPENKKHESVSMDLEDEEVFPAEIHPPKLARDPSRLAGIAGGYTWLVRPDYLANNLYSQVGKSMSRTGGQVDSALRVERGIGSRDPQATIQNEIKAIEESFNKSKVIPQHSTNPNAYPVEILDILPHVDIENLSALIRYDEDPIDEITSKLKETGNEVSEEEIKLTHGGSALLSFDKDHHSLYYADDMQMDESNKEKKRI